MGKLYEINQTLMNLQETEDGIICTLTGELLTTADLKKLAVEKDTVIENLACWYKELETDADGIDAEIKRLQERKKAKKNKAEQLKKVLADELDGKKFETPKCVMSFRKSTSVAVDNEDIIPSGYLVEQKPKVDKVAIKKALNAGIEVAGCRLETKNNLQIK